MPTYASFTNESSSSATIGVESAFIGAFKAFRPRHSMIADIRQSISDWIFRAKVPESPPVTLVQRRIFILPTKQGYAFAFTMLILLLSSINYALSLGFILTFTLVSMAGVAMLHTWRNLAHLRLRPGRCDPVGAWRSPTS